MDPGLNSLLQWGIKNSAASQSEVTTSSPPASQSLNTEALRALMGGPSDADLMRDAITIIADPSTTAESKLIAFDNFEQLVENIDNANNIKALGLWDPLVTQLSSPEPDLRRMAAWCIGTAVQNNVAAQECALVANAVPKLCQLALEDGDAGVRRKAVYALSSEVRNYQPAMDGAVKILPKSIVGPDHLSCADMDVIDAIMEKLRDTPAQ